MACLTDTGTAADKGDNSNDTSQDTNDSNDNINHNNTGKQQQQEQQQEQQELNASPDGKKPIPRRNLSQAFEALCNSTSGLQQDSEFTTLLQDDDHDNNNNKMIHLVAPPTISTTEMLDKNNIAQQPALISPTTVTDIMGINNNINSAVATPTPTAATPAAAAPPPPIVVTTSPPALLRCYEFDLHPDLRRELSQALVNRVSFYGIIHDINKEATCMAANDPKPGQGGGDIVIFPMLHHSMDNGNKEEDSPLIQAVTGETSHRSESAVTAAMIDEEQWLLDAIHTRRPEERSTTTTTANGMSSSSLAQPPVCPPTFSQAMGEKEYENPVHALSGGNRTQLWKPSRSWWEAKSGKNPWIEPSSHNKRWRYLWPLIHYHKFLAKCIKKLKRNGVDVKHSVSPVAVFLREEVCAVSDHLKDVSLFGSDEWIASLHHFNGWTDMASEEDLRKLVGTLKLRPLSEPGDVDSPLLRSQIDEHFLRAMEAARTQLRDGPTTTAAATTTATTSSASTGTVNNLTDTVTKNKLHSQQQHNKGHPPMYPRQQQHHASAAALTHNGATPSHVTQQSGLRRPRFVPTPTTTTMGGYGNHHHAHQQYWGWEQQHHHHHSQSAQQLQQPPPVAYGDNGSVQSGLSTDSCYGGGVGYSEYPTHAAPMSYPYYSPAGYVSDGSQYSYEHHHADMSAYHQQHHHHQQHVGWGDPSMAYAMHANHNAYYGGTPMVPPTPLQPTTEGSQQDGRDGKEALSPVKYSRPPLQQSQSPFWSHLDSCVALGLATPAKLTPSTPRRGEDEDATDDYKEEGEDVVDDYHQYKVISAEDLAGYSHEEKSSSNGFSSNAQPLLLRQYYGGYSHYGAHDGYAPPSPATQFMMSPQQNFAYNIGYGLSPGRQGRTPRKRTVVANANAPPLPMAQKTPTLSPTATTTTKNAPLMPPPSVHKGMERISPSTVETTTDSDLEDHALAATTTTN